jgi:hypothetical protein
MIYREPSFLVAFSLSQYFCVSPVELTDVREGVGDGREAKSYDLRKAWPSINHAILPGVEPMLAYKSHRSRAKGQPGMEKVLNEEPFNSSQTPIFHSG